MLMLDASVKPRRTADGIEVEASAYVWRWSSSSGTAELRGNDRRLIVSYPLQPIITTGGAGSPGPGALAEVRLDGNRFRVRYKGVNGGGALHIAVRFEPAHFVIERIEYQPWGGEAIVALSHFARWDNDAVCPAARASACVIPGGRQDPEQAIFPTESADDTRFSIGCFGMDAGTYHQQWALPHYLVSCYNTEPGGEPVSGAACIGLGAIPDGSVTARVSRGAFSYEINFRGDLWGHRRGPSTQRFGFPLVVAVAPDWYQAGLAYFAALASEGYAPKRSPESVPETAFWAQYDTWGDQASRRCILHLLNEAHLRAMGDDFRASGLRSRLFVIDDKWERVYGSLAHDEERFPSFDEALDRIRSNGCEIGLWTAFPRCEDYRAIGLTEEAVLVRPDGAPYVCKQGNRSWYVFDPTNTKAAAYLAGRARRLVERYRPAMVKIDFGYEIPPPDVAGPHDPKHGGELLFQRFLEIIAGAIKEADRRVAILYYCVTPLFNGLIDQCGMDDLWMSRGRYDDGFAKRALLSTWCGAFGMVPYGSTGYDWRSAAEIWLDTAIIGTPGVIAPLHGDEYGEKPSPDLIARYNGVARIARRNPYYTVQIFDADLFDAVNGPRARSWARIEDGQTVVAVLRPGDTGVALAPGIAEATCRVAIASLTDASLATAPAVGIVPFETGRVTLRRSRPGAAHARALLLDGRFSPWQVTIDGRDVHVDAAGAADDGTPVEMIELRFG